MPTAKQLLVWCLLAALPIHGFSATVVQLLGPRHSHRPSASPANPLEGWIDVRRGTSIAQTTAPPRHVHSHGLFERHHHGPGDGSVVALDGAEPGVDGDGGSSTGSLTQAIALATVLTIAPAPAARGRWHRAADAAVGMRAGDRLERPPPIA